MNPDVTVEDVQQLDKDDAIAFRVAFEEEDGYDVVAGEVSSEPASKTEIEEELEEYDTGRIVTFDGDLWWSLSDGEFTDLSHRIQDMEPYQEFLGDPPKDAPPCSLELEPDGSISVVIPSPIWRGSRVYFYDTRPRGTVVALDSGGLVEPRHLLPDGYDGENPSGSSSIGGGR